MRLLRAAPVLALGLTMTASAGCLRDDTGAVLLHFTQKIDLSPPLVSYSSSTAAVAFSSDGPVLFSATSNQGTLRLLLDGPLVDGTVQLPSDEERVHFDFLDAGWGNQGGSVFILSVNPAIVRLDNVPMVARSGSAVGSFVFQGAGTFR